MTSWPNYCNDAKVWLPMTQAAHDAGNVRTLDVSGNGLHYRFGDGSTAGTFPTKLSGQRGYQFDGSNDYLEALENQTNAITEGTWAVFARLTANAGTYDVYSHFDSGGITRAFILTGTTTIQFFCGDNANATAISIIPYLGSACFIAGRRTTDGFRRLFVNGENSVPNNTGVTLPGAPSVPPRIGRRAYSTNYWPGRIFWYGHWEYALTELQLRDLESRLRKEFNNV